MCLVSFAVDSDSALLAGHTTLDIKFIGLKWRQLHSCHGRSFTHIRQWHGMILLHKSKCQDVVTEGEKNLLTFQKREALL